MLEAIRQAWKFIKERRAVEWPSVRRRHLAANATCAACGTKDKLEVHHIHPVGWPDGKHLELVPGNLITLCEKNGCHLRFGHLGDYKSRNENVRDDAAKWLTKYATRPYPGGRQMKLTGHVEAKLVPSGDGWATVAALISQCHTEDGKLFFGGLSIQSFHPSLTPEEVAEAQPIVDAINGLKIEDLDDLAVAQAKICDAFLFFNDQQEKFAKKHGVTLAKLAKHKAKKAKP